MCDRCFPFPLVLSVDDKKNDENIHLTSLLKMQNFNNFWLRLDPPLTNRFSSEMQIFKIFIFTTKLFHSKEKECNNNGI